MSLDLKMPALSPTMETGTLARWLVAVGDTVKPGDLLAEIETDKATMEFESADEGRIAELLVAAGAEDVAVGTVIARLSTDADEAKGASASASRQPEPVAEAPAPIASAAKALPPSTPPPPASVPAPPANADRANASPLARRLAQVLGVDLDPISGSGPNGRILKQDVLPAPTPRTATVAAAPVAPIQIRQDEAPAAAVPDIPHQVIALSSMRKTIVRRLTASKQQVPHIYLTVELELDPLLALRTSLNDALKPRGVKLSINDMLIKAQAAALMAVPSCNVMLSGDQLVRFSRADIAVAVSIDGGLITPIIKGADSKSLSAITVEMKALAQSARDGRLTPDQYQGGTASLSNMGMYGIKQFAAVINPPQGLILAIGASSRQPIVRGDQIDIGTLMSVTGSFDHRVVDGADAAAFLAAFKTVVENPLSSLA